MIVKCFRFDRTGSDSEMRLSDFRILTKSFKRIIDPYLNSPSNSEQDLSNKEMGHSLQLFTPPQDKDTIKDHWEDYELDAQHDSHMDDDYSYQRYVSNFNINTVADC